MAGRFSGRSDGAKYIVRISGYQSILKKAESGDYSEKVTPVPIPNTEVKLLRADDTWWATAWESRSLPVQLKSRACKCPAFLVFHLITTV